VYIPSLYFYDLSMGGTIGGTMEGWLCLDKWW